MGNLMHEKVCLCVSVKGKISWIIELIGKLLSPLIWQFVNRSRSSLVPLPSQRYPASQLFGQRRCPKESGLPFAIVLGKKPKLLASIFLVFRPIQERFVFGDFKTFFLIHIPCPKAIVTLSQRNEREVIKCKIIAHAPLKIRRLNRIRYVSLQLQKYLDLSSVF